MIWDNQWKKTTLSVIANNEIFFYQEPLAAQDDALDQDKISSIIIAKNSRYERNAFGEEHNESGLNKHDPRNGRGRTLFRNDYRPACSRAIRSSALASGQSRAITPPFRYPSRSSTDRWASIRRTDRRSPLMRAMVMDS